MERYVAGKTTKANMKPPKISICIPVYKRAEHVERLLRSIRNQTFKDFEVVVSDDSPDETISSMLKQYGDLRIIYFRNSPSLGTPANWNFAISKASGEWIKLMHDDDWFADQDSLRIFVKATNSGKQFIFSAFTNIFESGEKQQHLFPLAWEKRIIKNPLSLMAKNVIGPPSVTMVHHSIKEQYDIFMKWRVDIDFYIRVLKKERSFSVINKPLINVGIGASQVTNDCFNVAEIELPEALLMLKKYGLRPLESIVVYDAWWRMLRNLEIREKEDLHKHTGNDQWPRVIMNMVSHQSYLPLGLLKIGFFSKPFMFISYLINRKYLK